VAVEKLLPAKFAKTKLRQDALQTTFSVFLNIFYPPNFRCFDENGVFQPPQAITLTQNRADFSVKGQNALWRYNANHYES